MLSLSTERRSVAMAQHSTVLGNVSDDLKLLAVKALARFIGTTATSYSAEIGQRLKLVEINLLERVGSPKEAQTVCEIEVKRDMCNIYGTLHGGCAAFLIDPCSVSAIICLGLVTGVDGTGVSQSMDIKWHRPAHLGAVLRLISTTLYIDGRVRTARCEVRDKRTGELYISAVHSTVNPRYGREKQKL